MPFEPFYHRDPNKPFALHHAKQIIHIVIENRSNDDAHVQSYKLWITKNMERVPLHFQWHRHSDTLSLEGTVFNVVLKTDEWHGASQSSQSHLVYNINHNVTQQYDEPTVVHEFLHVLGIPHEIHNPLIHYCLKPNWRNILDWEKQRDLEVLRLQKEGKTDEANWVRWHAKIALEDFYYCLRWTLFSDDIDVAYKFDPYHACGGSTDLFALYMDPIPGTNDIFTPRGIIVDNKRLMTPDLETFLQYRLQRKQAPMNIARRKKWYMYSDRYDPTIFLPDQYLKRLDYSNPFMKKLIDDDYPCVEDQQFFKYQTMHRYVNLEGVDEDTKKRCINQLAIVNHRPCDPNRKDNFLNIWDSSKSTFKVCPTYSDALQKYCVSPTHTPPSDTRPPPSSTPSSATRPPPSPAQSSSTRLPLSPRTFKPYIYASVIEPSSSPRPTSSLEPQDVQIIVLVASISTILVFAMTALLVYGKKKK